MKSRADGVPAIVTLWDNSVGQPDIDNTASYFLLPSARNYNKDSKLEKLASAGRSELDPEKRPAIYRKMFDKLSSSFGVRHHALGGGGTEQHSGIDISAAAGTPISAASAGTVGALFDFGKADGICI